MAVKKLKPLLSKFHKEIGAALNLLHLANDVREAYQPKRGPKLSNSAVALIAEISFLKIFVAFENFIENTFLYYMLGGKSPNKYCPIRYVFPKDKEHAIKMTLQDYSNYTDWSTPDKIVKRAEYTFKNGEPFKTGIASYIQILQDLKIIRNYITHSSENAKDKFEIRARFYLGTLPPGNVLTVGNFLLMYSPQNTRPICFIEFFAEKLKDFSSNLIP